MNLKSVGTLKGLIVAAAAPCTGNAAVRLQNATVDSQNEAVRFENEAVNSRNKAVKPSSAP